MKTIIAHLNMVGFRASVASAKDRTLSGRPFVVGSSRGGRALVWDVSPEALRSGIWPGMALSLAQRKVKELVTIAPDTEAYSRANAAIERIVQNYTPAYQNDRAGNLFLNLTGTQALFGTAIDTTNHICTRILETTGIGAAAAVGGNKIVTKVGTRSIRPLGLVHIRDGEEAAFLSHQDIRLMPGVGPSILRTLSVTGFREIGELAALPDNEVLSLLGRRGILLRDYARGIDTRPVDAAGAGSGALRQRLDFAEDVIDRDVIGAALASLTESAALEMRLAKMGAGRIELAAVYADGARVTGRETGKTLFILDRDIEAAANRVYDRIATRRLRVRSLGLGLCALGPLFRAADLFVPDEEEKHRSLQAAADKVRVKYGAEKLLKASALAASRIAPKLLTGGADCG